MPGKLKLETILLRANQIHNNKYDYSLITEYKGTMTKYLIKCPTHGVWDVSLDNHIIKKSGCPKCKGFGFSFEEKIKKANQIHNNKYDYSLIKGVINGNINYNFICKKCSHIFNNSWSNHIHKKQGCPKCNPCGRKKLTIENLKEQTNKLNTGYEYNWDSYKGYFDNGFQIKCQKHGWFNQQLSNHLMGQRCPKCKQSQGEKEIEQFLIENNIKYETQKTFEGCKSKRMLPFDFYIPSKNLCIEYDGEMHYKAIEFFGGNKSLEKQIKHDNIKNEFCKNNNINLLRISYINFKNIKNLLSNEI
jgi:Zn finger protein HypA/HybF involved in hydrogenase expression